MMDTLRNGLRVLGSAILKSELIYSFLMGLGWFFLMAWAVALLVACTSAFCKDGNGAFTGFSPGSRPGKLMKSSRF